MKLKLRQTEPRAGTGFSHTFPAHSISLIEVPA
jgi:hypothetical protein